MKSLALRNLGQLKDANICFGDLTVLVGKQATGKTLFLEMLKLAVDTGYIQSELTNHGFDWGKKKETFFDLYLGEGMRSVLREASRIVIDSKPHRLEDFARGRKASKHRLMYIPAQRVLTLQQGWPQPFQSYGAQDPYVVREFSERLRWLMESSRNGLLFPQTKRLKKAHRDMLVEHIFGDFKLTIDIHGARKRLVLSHGQTDSPIPFMTWSAGQREFVPLLLGLHWLLPGAGAKRAEDIEWVVIEELEAGLHPAAISAVMLIVFEMLARGYKVCLSTHAPHVLDIAWAMQTLKRESAPADRVLDLFQAEKSQTMRKVAETVIKKDIRVYYFDDATGDTQDISTLDPSSDDDVLAGWGGLTGYGGRIADVIADTMAAGIG